MWRKVKAAFNKTSESVLGYSRKSPQKDWISDDTYKIVEQRRMLTLVRIGLFDEH